MPKVVNPDDLSKAILTYNPDVALEAFKNEASRQTGLMIRWMDIHKKQDPEMMSEIFEEEGLYRAVSTARKYRKRIYDRNRAIQEYTIRHGAAVLALEKTGDTKWQEEIDECLQALMKETDEQIKWFWRIYKIFSMVQRRAGTLLSMGRADFDPFDIGEYEYDPEKS